MKGAGLRLGAACAALGAALASSAALATNGYFAHGYGMKAKGMAGVGIALPQDAMAAATNPAGMAWVGTRFDAGLDVFRPDRGADIVGNAGVAPMGVPSLDGSYDGNGKRTFLIPEFGYNRVIDPALSIGVVVYGNGGMNTQYDRSPFTAMGGSSPAGVDLSQLFIAPTVSYRIAPGHALGVSLNVAYQQFSATGFGPFGQFGLSSNPAALTDNGNDSATGVGLRVGWTGAITPTITMGATWQSKTRMSRLDKYAGLFADQGRFDIPANWGVGIAAKLSPAVTVALDVQRIEYAGVTAVGNPIDSLFGGKLLGADDGPGFGWNDITVIKLGANWALTDALTLRAGYSHSDQPIPANQTFFNILAPGTIRHHVSIGATWAIGARQELTFAYTHGLRQKVDGSNSIPPNFGGGNANIRLSEDILGVAWAWKF
ncbi:MAG: OmpP1/FadL family transporter [Lautropia sp.]